MIQEPWEGKYGAEVVFREADWNAALGVGQPDVEPDTIDGAVTATVLGSDTLTAEVISTTDGITRVKLSEGGTAANRSVRVSLKATGASGQIYEAVIPMPIFRT